MFSLILLRNDLRHQTKTTRNPGTPSEEQCALGYRQAGIQLLPAFPGALGLELVLKLLQGTGISHASHWRIRKQTGQLFPALHDQDTKQIWHIFYLLLTSDRSTLNLWFCFEIVLWSSCWSLHYCVPRAPLLWLSPSVFWVYRCTSPYPVNVILGVGSRALCVLYSALPTKPRPRHSAVNTLKK